MTSVMQHLFILLFSTGIFPIIPSLPRKYYLIQELKTWSEALAYCQANHTDLATITSNDDMLQIQNVSQSQQFTSSAWIGLYNDITSWRWSFQNTPLGNVMYWDSNQPDNHNGKEACGVINRGIWSDMPCETPFPFLCYNDKAIGIYRYIYNSSKLTWPNAQTFCRQKYTDLASASDALEALLIDQVISSGNIWFGLFRDSWKWTDHTNMSILEWKDGQPDNKKHLEDCGYLLNGKAEDQLCSVKMPFFCHSEITGQKQIIRVKVQSEQDVNDPEVKSAILAKVKEKLEENGIAETTTAMWRQQPDGEVFYKERTDKGEL